MRVPVQCPSCSERFEVNDSLVGKKVKCRACQKPFLAEADAAPEERGTAIQEPGRRVAAVRSPRDEDDGPARSRGGRRDDEDDDRSRGAGKEQERRSGVPLGWILGGAAALLVGLIAIVLLIVFAGFGMLVLRRDAQQDAAPVAVMDFAKIDQGKPDPAKIEPVRPDPPRDNPFPKKVDGPPKKDPLPPIPIPPIPDPFKKDVVEDVPWAYAADPGPALKAPAKAASFLTFIGNPHIVFPKTPSPFVAVRHGQFPNEGWQFFDLESAKLTGQILAKLELDKEALSPDGKFLAGKARGLDFKQSVVNVHAVAQGGKIARSITVDTDAASLRWIDFLEDDHLLTYKTHGLTAHFEIWNAQGLRVQHITLKGLLDERERMCLSPGRKYLAVADDQGIHVYHATEGKKFGLLRPPIGFSTYTGMAFSPDGQELAVYGSQFGASSQMLVYTLAKGELALDHKFAKDVGTMVKHRFGYKGQPLEWMPDKSGWMMWGQMLIDYVSGAPVYDMVWPAQEFSYFPRRFIGNDHVVTAGKDAKGTRVEYVALPKEKIAKAVQQARAGGAAPSELPAAKNGDLANAVQLPNPGGNVAWKVVPDPAGKPKGALGKQPIALRGPADGIQSIFFSSPEVGQAAILDAFQPNPLATRRQFRIDRFDLVKGDHLGTTELFALDAPAQALPFPAGPGGPGKATAFFAADASPGGTRFAACRVKEPGRLDVWNLSDGKHLVAWKPVADKVEWCGFVDEDRVLTLGDGKLVLWKLPELRAEYVVEGYKGTPQFSANRKQLLLLNGAALELIESATGQRLGQLEAPPGLTLTRLQSAAFSGDGKELVALVFTANGNQIVRWDLMGGNFKDRMDAPLAMNATLLWAGPKHVLAGTTLYNWDLKAAIWQYGQFGKGTYAAGSPDGRHWYAVSTGKEGPSVLTAQSVPDPEASQLAKLISAGQVKLAIPPGTNVQVAVNGYGAAQNEIQTSLLNSLKTAGFNAGPGGVTLSLSAQEMSTGKLLDYEIRKVGKFGLPMGIGKQMVKIAEKKVVCQLAITDAAGALLEKRDANFTTPGSLTFEGDNYQMELDRVMWNNAASFARSAMVPTNLYRVQGQLLTLPRHGTLKAGG